MILACTEMKPPKDEFAFSAWQESSSSSRRTKPVKNEIANAEQSPEIADEQPQNIELNESKTPVKSEQTEPVIPKSVPITNEKGRDENIWPAPSAPFPKKVAGFPFEIRIEEFLRLCRSAGHQAMPIDNDSAVCNRTVISPGFEAPIIANSYEGRIGEYFFMLNEAISKQAPINLLISIQRQLETKYGPPNTPPDMNEGNVAELSISCPAGRSILFRRQWFFGPAMKADYEPGNILLLFRCGKQRDENHFLLFYRNARGLKARFKEFKNKQENF